MALDKKSVYQRVEQVVGNGHTAVDHPELQCSVASISYDYADRHGIAVLDSGDCTDMKGCIDLFERIDPKVIAITMVSGAEVDTVYLRTASGWIAR